MRAFDLSPLFRSTVGFDRLFDMLDPRPQVDAGSRYPPYNIERTDETHYRISLAVAGFAEKDLSVEVREGVLTVQGKRDDEQEGEDRLSPSRHCRPRASSAASSSPRMSRSGAPSSRTGCSMSISSASCPKRRSPAGSPSTAPK